MNLYLGALSKGKKPVFIGAQVLYGFFYVGWKKASCTALCMKGCKKVSLSPFGLVLLQQIEGSEQNKLL